MNDVLEFISELKELQTLYISGDLREFDFALKINDYEAQVAKFEKDMFAEQEAFWKTPTIKAG
jgi:hypothetical protein